MITTNLISDFSKDNRFFSCGTGKETVLIQGSCRILAYANYINYWNQTHDRFKIYVIMPYTFINKENINNLETNPEFLDIVKNTKIYITEYIGFEKPQLPIASKIADLGILNVSQQMTKNIYQFGLNPDQHIIIPSWDNHFVMVNDILQFNKEMKARYDAKEDITEKLHEIIEKHFDTFYSNTSKTDLPEFAEYFEETFQFKRLYWTMNHNTKNFTLPLFRMLNDKFLHLDFNDAMYNKIAEKDHLEGNKTQLHRIDYALYNYRWQ